MLKSDELTSSNSCLNRARADEMNFVFVEDDEAAPATIRAWIAERIRLGRNKAVDQKLVTAEAVAVAMEKSKAASMRGTRIDASNADYDDQGWRGYPYPRLQAGDYGKDKDGNWFGVPPGTDPFTSVASLGDGSGAHGHGVIEHADGTITVRP